MFSQSGPFGKLTLQIGYELFTIGQCAVGIRAHLRASSGTVSLPDHTVTDAGHHRLSIGTIRAASANSRQRRKGVTQRESRAPAVATVPPHNEKDLAWLGAQPYCWTTPRATVLSERLHWQISDAEILYREAVPFLRSEISRRSCSVHSNDRPGLVVGCVSRRQ